MAKKYQITFVVRKEGNTQKAKKEILKEMLEKGIKQFEVKPISELRTQSQSNALHLWFTQIADVLNENGITAQQIFSRPVEHFWTPELIKEIWRKIQKAMFGQRSTTKLKKTEQIDKIVDVLTKLIAERAKIEVPPFPSIEQLYENENGTKL